MRLLHELLAVALALAVTAAWWLTVRLAAIQVGDLNPTVAVALVAAIPALFQLFLTARSEHSRRKSESAAKQAALDAKRGEARIEEDEARYQRMQATAEQLRADLVEAISVKNGELASARAEMAEMKERHARELAYMNGRLERLEGDRWLYRQLLLRGGMGVDELAAAEREHRGALGEGAGDQDGS